MDSNGTLSILALGRLSKQNILSLGSTPPEPTEEARDHTLARIRPHRPNVGTRVCERERETGAIALRVRLRNLSECIISSPRRAYRCEHKRVGEHNVGFFSREPLRLGIRILTEESSSRRRRQSSSTSSSSSSASSSCSLVVGKQTDAANAAGMFVSLFLQRHLSGVPGPRPCRSTQASP